MTAGGAQAGGAKHCLWCTGPDREQPNEIHRLLANPRMQAKRGREEKQPRHGLMFFSTAIISRLSTLVGFVAFVGFFFHPTLDLLLPGVIFPNLTYFGKIESWVWQANTCITARITSSSSSWELSHIHFTRLLRH